MKKFKVHANEILYYLATEIKAETKEKAEAKYLRLLTAGKIEVNDSDLIEIESEEIKNSPKTTLSVKTVRQNRRQYLLTMI